MGRGGGGGLGGEAGGRGGGWPGAGGQGAASNPRLHTFSTLPTAASSLSLKPVTSRPLTMGSPFAAQADTRAAGPWHTVMYFVGREGKELDGGEEQ